MASRGSGKRCELAKRTSRALLGLQLATTVQRREPLIRYVGLLTIDFTSPVFLSSPYEGVCPLAMACSHDTDPTVPVPPLVDLLLAFRACTVVVQLTPVLPWSDGYSRLTSGPTCVCTACRKYWARFPFPCPLSPGMHPPKGKMIRRRQIVVVFDLGGK